MNRTKWLIAGLVLCIASASAFFVGYELGYHKATKEYHVELYRFKLARDVVMLLAANQKDLAARKILQLAEYVEEKKGPAEAEEYYEELAGANQYRHTKESGIAKKWLARRGMRAAKN